MSGKPNITSKPTGYSSKKPYHILDRFEGCRSAAVILTLAAETTFAQLSAGKQVTPVSAKICVISILSGAGAAYGEAITNGFKLARDEINANGNLRIELTIEDSFGNQEQVLAAAQKLINSDREEMINLALQMFR